MAGGGFGSGGSEAIILPRAPLGKLHNEFKCASTDVKSDFLVHVCLLDAITLGDGV